MKIKRDVKQELLEHSKAKIEFYKTYLERYLIILGNSKYIQTINIYDLFCGKGIYDNNVKGSPIEAFEVIKNYHQLDI